MSRQRNIDNQKAFGAEIANGHDAGAIDRLVHQDFVDHDPAPDQGPGANGFRSFWTAFLGSFPDLELSVDQLTADEDTVAIAYRAQGTQEGAFAGKEPTGRRIDIRGVQITRFDDDGLMVERWGSSDQLSAMQQLGHVEA